MRGAEVHLHITGTNYPNADGSSREKNIGNCVEGETLFLRHTPVPQDKNAVRIFRQNGEELGWIPRENAGQIAKLLDRGKKIEAIFVSTYRSYMNAPLSAEVAVTLTDVMVMTNKKRTLIGCGVLLVIFICLLIFMSTCWDNLFKKETTPSGQINYTEISAADLYQAYHNNSVRADQLYKDQFLKISGVVSSIGTELLGHPYIVLTGGGEYEMWGVQCLFPSTDEVKNIVASYNKGDRVWITGKCTGYLINVMLEVQ